MYGNKIAATFPPVSLIACEIFSYIRSFFFPNLSIGESAQCERRDSERYTISR